MPAPTNISLATATEITLLPEIISQDVHFGGVTYTVWYKYTAIENDCVLGLYGYGDLSIYRPQVRVWVLPGPSNYLSLVSDENTPMQFPVTAGTTYYFEVITNSGNPTPAVLTLDIKKAPQLAVPAGSIIISDDKNGFPAVALDSTTGAVLNTVGGFAAGESGDVSPIDGTVVATSQQAVGGDGKTRVYNKSLVVSITSSWTFTSYDLVRVNPSTGEYWIWDNTSQQFKRVNTLLDINYQTANFATSNLATSCSNLANTIMYYATLTVGQPVKRWNLSTDAAMSDLVAAIANYFVTDILVLTDDTIIVVYYKLTGTDDIIIKHYDTGGGVLHTYNIGEEQLPYTPASNLNAALDDPAHFWLRSHSMDNFTRVRKIKVSDGSYAVDLTIPEFSEGVLFSTYVATLNKARFGVSPSCPFLITKKAPEGVTGCSQIHSAGGGIYKLEAGKTNDTVIVGSTEETRDIPNPFIITAPLGD